MKTTHIVIGLSVFFNVLLVVFLFGPQKDTAISATKPPERSQYRFLSPRIFISDQNDLIINFTKLRDAMREYTLRSKPRTGIYFEYLPTGTSIGVNEKETFIPASLLKLPLAMGVYKKIEAGKLDPNKTLVLREKDIDKGFGMLWEKGVGYKLTVSDALHILIRDSDNTAQHVLYGELAGDEIDTIFDALDIPKERNDEKQAVVSPKNYTSILRCLYLACYLSKQNSDQLLRMLTETQFNDKLPAGLPQEVKIAHKVGVAVSPENENSEIYTDCGIIYASKRPYSLCIMTESNENEARVIMQDISSIVYKYVKSAN